MKRTTTFAFAAASLFGTSLFWIEAACGQSAFNQLEQRLQPPASGSGVAAAAPRGGYLGFVPDEEGEQGRGVRVKSVKPGAPAAMGGLKDGDLITAVDGKPVTGLSQFDAILDRTAPGQKLPMTIDRGGRSQQVTMTLGTPPAARREADQNSGGLSLGSPSLTSPTSPASGTGSFSAPAAPNAAGTPPSLASPTNPGTSAASGAPSLSPPTGGGASPAPPTLQAPAGSDGGSRGLGIRAQPLDIGPPPVDAADAVPPPVPGGFESPGGTALRGSAGGGASLGITVVPLTEQLRAAAGVTIRRGAVIADIKPGSPADLAGLPRGAVIARIDGRDVNSADDLVAAIRTARPGQQVELTYYEGNQINRKSVRLAPAGSAAAPGAPDPAASISNAPAFGGAFGGQAAAGPATVTPPNSAPRMGADGSGGNRPLLQRIERMAEGLTRPMGTSTVYDPLVMATLQTRVVELTEYTKELEERLRVLEGKLGVAAGAASGPGKNATPAAPGFGSRILTPGSSPGFGPASGFGPGPPRAGTIP